MSYLTSYLSPLYSTHLSSVLRLHLYLFSNIVIFQHIPDTFCTLLRTLVDLIKNYLASPLISSKLLETTIIFYFLIFLSSYL